MEGPAEDPESDVCSVGNGNIRSRRPCVSILRDVSHVCGSQSSCKCAHISRTSSICSASSVRIGTSPLLGNSGLLTASTGCSVGSGLGSSLMPSCVRACLFAGCSAGSAMDVRLRFLEAVFLGAGGGVSTFFSFSWVALERVALVIVNIRRDSARVYTPAVSTRLWRQVRNARVDQTRRVVAQITRKITPVGFGSAQRAETPKQSIDPFFIFLTACNKFSESASHGKRRILTYQQRYLPCFY